MCRDYANCQLMGSEFTIRNHGAKQRRRRVSAWRAHEIRFTVYFPLTKNPAGVAIVRLKKIKRPGGAGDFELEPLLEDEFGIWLHGATGSVWKDLRQAEASSRLTLWCCSIPTLFSVAWWVDDPGDRRLEIDVCLCPQRELDGWSYIDLELDPVRHLRWERGNPGPR